jgi:hypothetical protein
MEQRKLGYTPAKSLADWGRVGIRSVIAPGVVDALYSGKRLFSREREKLIEKIPWTAWIAETLLQ